MKGGKGAGRKGGKGKGGVFGNGVTKFNNQGTKIDLIACSNPPIQRQ